MIAKVEETVDCVCWADGSAESTDGILQSPERRKQQSWEPRELSWFAAAQQFSQNQTQVVSSDCQPDFLAVFFQASQPCAAGSAGFADVG